MHVQADTHTLKQTLKSSVYIFRVLRFMLANLYFPAWVWVSGFLGTSFRRHGLCGNSESNACVGWGSPHRSSPGLVFRLMFCGTQSRCGRSLGISPSRTAPTVASAHRDVIHQASSPAFALPPRAEHGCFISRRDTSTAEQLMMSAGWHRLWNIFCYRHSWR